VREFIERVGAEVLYLPPYSPDLNPIEKAWAKLKQLLRARPKRAPKKPSNKPSQTLSNSLTPTTQKHGSNSAQMDYSKY